MSEAARSHRSDVRVEPYMGSPADVRSDAGNPLAELARVVGQDDPFRAMFRQTKSSARPVADPIVEFPRQSETETDHAAAEAYADHPQAAYAYAEEDSGDLGLRPSVHESQDWAEPDAEHWGPAEAGHYPDPVAYDDDAAREHPVEALPGSAAHYDAPPLTPDLWAGNGEASEAPYADQPLSDETSDDSKSPRRPLIVLMAVLALTGGGLAATFLARSGPAVVSNDGSAPTIMAATSPTKIKQSDGTPDAATVDADAALLSTKVGNSGPVKVVNSQEQPIDLAQLPKTAGASGDGAATSSPFPEPKKVKTFLVRPDGSLVNSGSAAPAPVRSTVPQFAVGAGGSDTAAAPVPAARPSTPKTGNHSSATPKSPPASIADLAADANAGDDVNAAKQPVSSGAKPSGGKPVEMADASTPDTTASTGNGGNFALQLAASPNEQDARSAFTKLQKKYSELGGFQPTVKKVDNGQKTLYRLRVGNLSQDHAKTLCSQLQASGGTCFVVHN